MKQTNYKSQGRFVLTSEVSYDRTNSSLFCLFSVNSNSLKDGRKNIIKHVVRNNLFF